MGLLGPVSEVAALTLFAFEAYCIIFFSDKSYRSAVWRLNGGRGW